MAIATACVRAKKPRPEVTQKPVWATLLGAVRPPNKVAHFYTATWPLFAPGLTVSGVNGVSGAPFLRTENKIPNSEDVNNIISTHKGGGENPVNPRKPRADCWEGFI